MTRKLLGLTLLAAVIYGGFIYAAINTVCTDTGVDW